MERIKISICGRDFNLKSDNPDRLYSVAEIVQKKIDKMNSMASSMSLTDVVMLTALDFADENYDTRTAIENAMKAANDIKLKCSESEAKAVDLEKQMSDASSELAALKVSLSEAQSELCAVKEKLSDYNPDNEKRLSEENETLKNQIAELENKNSRMETAWNTLKSDFDKTQSKNKEDTAQLEELEELRNTVATYEKAFDEYAAQRNSEVKELNEELTVLKKKYADLSNQMNEIVNDGQMTL